MFPLDNCSLNIASVADAMGNAIQQHNVISVGLSQTKTKRRGSAQSHPQSNRIVFALSQAALGCGLRSIQKAAPRAESDQQWCVVHCSSCHINPGWDKKEINCITLQGHDFWSEKTDYLRTWRHLVYGALASEMVFSTLRGRYQGPHRGATHEGTIALAEGARLSLPLGRGDLSAA